MAFAPGRVAYVEVDGTTKKFDSWGFSANCDMIESSDYDYRSAKYLPGLPTGNITLTGPYDVGELGMAQGQEYPIELGITASVFIETTILVSSIKLAQNARGVARVEVSCVINADMEAEVTIHEDL